MQKKTVFEILGNKKKFLNILLIFLKCNLKNCNYFKY